MNRCWRGITGEIDEETLEETLEWRLEEVRWRYLDDRGEKLGKCPLRVEMRMVNELGRGVYL